MPEQRLQINPTFSGTGFFLGNGIAVDNVDLNAQSPPVNRFDNFFYEASSDGEIFQTFLLPPGTTKLRLLFNITFISQYLPPLFGEDEGPANFSHGTSDGTIIITVNGVPIFVEAHSLLVGDNTFQYTDREFLVDASGLTEVRIRAFGHCSIRNSRLSFEFGFFETAARIISCFWTDAYAQIGPVQVPQCDCCCCLEG